MSRHVRNRDALAPAISTTRTVRDVPAGTGTSRSGAATPGLLADIVFTDGYTIAVDLSDATPLGGVARHVDATTLTDGRPAGVFNLLGRAVGGSYEYFLHQGSVTDATDGDWYLRPEREIPVGPPAATAATARRWA